MPPKTLWLLNANSDANAIVVFGLRGGAARGLPFDPAQRDLTMNRAVARFTVFR